MPAFTEAQRKTLQLKCIEEMITGETLMLEDVPVFTEAQRETLQLKCNNTLQLQPIQDVITQKKMPLNQILQLIKDLRALQQSLGRNDDDVREVLDSIFLPHRSQTLHQPGIFSSHREKSAEPLSKHRHDNPGPVAQ